MVTHMYLGHRMSPFAGLNGILTTSLVSRTLEVDSTLSLDVGSLRDEKLVDVYPTAVLCSAWEKGTLSPTDVSTNSEEKGEITNADATGLGLTKVDSEGTVVNPRNAWP